MEFKIVEFGFGEKDRIESEIVFYWIIGLIDNRLVLDCDLP